MELVGHRKFRLIFGFVITVALLYHLWSYSQAHPSFLTEVFTSVNHLHSLDVTFFILIIVLLTAINWGLEALKWKVLSREVLEVSFKDSLKDVLTGLVMSNFMPKSASDVIGRIGKDRKSSKWKMLGGLVINNSIQLSVTSFFGIITLVLVWDKYVSFSAYYLVSLILLFVLILIVLFGFREWVLKVIEVRFNKIHSSLKAIKEYSRVTLFQVLGLSLLRYATFSGQLLYVLYVMGYSHDFVLFLAPISLIYFAKAFVPSFNLLLDLGIKEYSHVFFLGFLSVTSADAVSAGFIVWGANMVLPSLVGLWFIWKR